MQKLRKLSLQDFSDIISHDNEAQMKPASGAYLRYVSERGEIATKLACRKNELKIVKD